MSTLEQAGWNLEATYQQLPSAFFSQVAPTAVDRPQLLLLNARVAERIGLEPAQIQDQLHAEIFAGNRLPAGSQPIAQAYAGHQFGGFTMLGDGRAILLGEQRTPEGQLVDIQLKGSGPTPYSRRGDGRAAMGPMLREYIISHALDALNIPTTLSLAVAATGESVYRQRVEVGAVLTRVASSHIRVGTFQFAAARGNISDLQALTDYTIARHYPELLNQPARVLGFLEQVVHRQARLIAQWMSVGFIHGVMNTDNVSIAGEAIDFGPCAFMNAYNPATVFSSIDSQGRYAFGNQPSIGQWNLARFAETLLPILAPDVNQAVEVATEVLNQFPNVYQENWLAIMARKLGVLEPNAGLQELLEELLALMERHELDLTNTFVALTHGSWSANVSEVGSATFSKLPTVLETWEQKWKMHLGSEGITQNQAQSTMQAANPQVIPRNHLVEEAISSATENGDFGPLSNLLEALKAPFRSGAIATHYTEPPAGGDRDYCTFCGT